MEDFDRDGHPDILMGGNLHEAKPEVGPYFSSYGVWLKGDGRGGFRAVPAGQSGFSSIGQIRQLARIETQNEQWILVAKNNDRLKLFSY